jgi:hypothetical protein
MVSPSCRAALSVMFAAAGYLCGCADLLGLPSDPERDEHLDCSGGECACARDFADCDQDAENACETDLLRTADHCGSCDHDCGDGNCVDGLCTPSLLASGLSTDIALYGNAIAFTTMGAAPFMVVPLDQQPPFPTDFGRNEPFSSCSVFGDGDRLFYATAVTKIGNTDLTYLLDVPPIEEKKAAIVRAVFPEGNAGVAKIVGVTGSYVYTRHPSFPPLPPVVCRSPREGLMAVPECFDFVEGSSMQAAAGGQDAYWSTSDGIVRLNDAETTPEVVVPASETGRILAEAVLGARLYFLDSFDVCPEGGGSMACTRLLSVGASMTEGVRKLAVFPVKQSLLMGLSAAIAGDGERVYVADGTQEGNLWSVTLEQSASAGSLVATSVFLANARLLAKNGELYWTDTAAIYRLSKPPGS